MQIPTKEGGVPRLEFIGEEEISVNELNAAVGNTNARPKDAAEEFLKRELRDGPRKAQEMLALAKQVGISERTLARARTRIRVQSEQKRGHWKWSLPPT